VVVTQVRPSPFLPDLINMTSSTIALCDTQMPGSVTQHTFATSFPHLSDDDTAVDGVDDDTDDTVITTNSKVPYEITEYNIKLLMMNEKDISNPALQQATMAVLHEISQQFGSDVCIPDGTGNQMSEFKIQATTTFPSKFHSLHLQHHFMTTSTS
jgi:hypothetical protein